MSLTTIGPILTRTALQYATRGCALAMLRPTVATSRGARISYAAFVQSRKIATQISPNIKTENRAPISDAVKPSIKERLFDRWITRITSPLHDLLNPLIARTPSHPIQFYSTETKDDLRLTYCSSILSAKKNITFIIYALTDAKVIQALKQKSEEGVDVNIICDAKASPGIDEKLGTKVHLTKRNGKGLMHQKILTIDENKTWIGSANMTSESLSHQGNLVMAIESKEISKLTMRKARQEIIPHQSFKLGTQTIETWFLPDDQDASLRLKELIRSAQKTIRVAMFTWTRHDLANTVIDAKNRGVKVEVVIDNYVGRGAGAKVVAFLQKEGIPLKLSQGKAFLHHKLMYIDEKILVNGSANWTKAAFNQNEDCFVVLNNLTEEQKVFLNKAWSVIYSTKSKTDKSIEL